MLTEVPFSDSAPTRPLLSQTLARVEVQTSPDGVTDTKSALPGASITLTNTATGVQVAAVTNARGEYRIQIPAGTYKLQAELTG
ncbi:MAG: carboxypeptidase regulatory-like domain-containing protein, partial [Acidobacteria bacterium]|nr:carboxypeptidase regulatory-like domain-containing protein [Acidobacteriota bacterium]